MKYLNYKCRPANREDASLIADVIALAFGDECVKTLCGDDYKKVLEEIARSEDAQYSYRNVIVAEVDGKPAGAVCGYDGDDIIKLRQRTLELIKKYTGNDAYIEEESSGGEFYIDSLAVLPEYRGKGLGRELLVAMRNHAFENGHQIVGLIVDENNPKAEALYNKLGFKRYNSMMLLGHKMWHLQAGVE